MSVPDEVRHDAEKTGKLVRKKLMEIMELQADMSVAANWGTTFALLAGQGRDESIAAEADQPHIRSWRARSGALATS
jgi:hypothetical protein